MSSKVSSPPEESSQNATAVNVYQRLPSWVLGFHGTDEETVDRILNDKKAHLRKSDNDYDWLGGGVYFWENDPKRAMDFSEERMRWKKIKDKRPMVIGAVIDLGLCMNLFDQPALEELQLGYEELAWDFDVIGQSADDGTFLPMPENKGKTSDRLMRHLDCAVIERVHRLRKDLGLAEYQTVRSGFHEGEEAFPGSKFCVKNHIQIAVRDPDCIRGYFLPRD